MSGRCWICGWLLHEDGPCPDVNTKPLAALAWLREHGLTRPRYNLASPYGHTPHPSGRGRRTT
jgi:hypothetical protein